MQTSVDGYIERKDWSKLMDYLMGSTKHHPDLLKFTLECVDKCKEFDKVGYFNDLLSAISVFINDNEVHQKTFYNFVIQNWNCTNVSFGELHSDRIDGWCYAKVKRKIDFLLNACTILLNKIFKGAKGLSRLIAEPRIFYVAAPDLRIIREMLCLVEDLCDLLPQNLSSTDENIAVLLKLFCRWWIGLKTEAVYDLQKHKEDAIQLFVENNSHLNAVYLMEKVFGIMKTSSPVYPQLDQDVDALIIVAVSHLYRMFPIVEAYEFARYKHELENHCCAENEQCQQRQERCEFYDSTPNKRKREEDNEPRKRTKPDDDSV